MGIVVQHHRETYNTDNANPVITVSADNAQHHYLSIESAASSGTAAIKITHYGGGERKTLATGFDLSDDSKQLVEFSTPIQDIEIDDSSIAADTDYTINYTATATK